MEMRLVFLRGSLCELRASMVNAFPGWFHHRGTALAQSSHREIHFPDRLRGVAPSWL